jgi:hypothetical protein
MVTVTAQQVTEGPVHKFSADASALGLRPGEWPARLETDLGNGLPFVRGGYESRGGELLLVRYIQAAGCIDLVVFND